MANTYTAFIKHTHIGKSSQAEPYTARAHSRYIQRRSETHVVRVHLMPDSYKARQRWWYDHENGLRKNGRVVDKLTFSIPHEISQAHAEKILFGFGLRLGQERCPFEFTLQGFESRNHHSHFMFVDRDYETGKRVFGTTERNSSHQIKLEWEYYANSQFEELGYDVRVKVHDGYELDATNDNQEALETSSVAASDVDDLSDIETSPEDTLTGDEGMAIIELEREENVSLVAHDIRLLRMTYLELNRLRDAKQRLHDAQERYTRAEALRVRAEQAASQHYADKLSPAEQKAFHARFLASQMTNERGKLKGFGVSLLGFQWKTQTRRIAEEAQHHHAQTEREVEHLKADQRDYNYAADTAHLAMIEAVQEQFHRHNALRALYGTDQEITEAENSFDRTIRKVISEVPPDYALEAFESMEITEDEYIEYLRQSGNEKALAEFMENRDKYVVMEVDDDYEV